MLRKNEVYGVKCAGCGRDFITAEANQQYCLSCQEEDTQDKLIDYSWTCGCQYKGGKGFFPCQDHTRDVPERIRKDVERFLKNDPSFVAVPSGSKYDKGKPPIDLLHRQYLEGAAQAMAYGAEKYNRHNWAGGIAYSRIYSALQRHLIAWNDGADFDKESGLPHLFHAGACLNMLMGMQVLHPELDDRYRRGK